jgi:hypothetical protein
MNRTQNTKIRIPKRTCYTHLQGQVGVSAGESSGALHLFFPGWSPGVFSGSGAGEPLSQDGAPEGSLKTLSSRRTQP